MTVGLIRPAEGEVLHFSEDPSISVFSPHVAETARQAEPYVWAVDFQRAPDYWFPRDCPRVLTWAGPGTSAADRELFLGPLLDAHEAAGIELRVLPELWPYWHRVKGSTISFSGIRLRNARPETS